MARPELLKKLPESDVTLSIVAKTIAENNVSSNKIRNQLEELQIWVEEQVKIFNSH